MPPLAESVAANAAPMLVFDKVAGLIVSAAAVHDIAPGGDVCPDAQAVCALAPAVATKKLAEASVQLA